MLHTMVSLIDDARVIIYDCNVFIKQATVANVIKRFTAVSYAFS
jgi:hypothetical protein